MGRMFFISKEDQVGVSANTIPPWLGGMVLADIQRDVGQGPKAPAPSLVKIYFMKLIQPQHLETASLWRRQINVNLNVLTLLCKLC